jgi:hypothetical protein
MKILEFGYTSSKWREYTNGKRNFSTGYPGAFTGCPTV